MDSLAASALPLIADFSPQHLGNTVWAFAKLSVANEPLIPAIAAAAIARLSQFGPQEITNTVWACAVLGYVNLPLLDALSSAAIPRIALGEATPLDLGNTAWAVATLV